MFQCTSYLFTHEYSIALEWDLMDEFQGNFYFVLGVGWGFEETQKLRKGLGGSNF